MTSLSAELTMLSEELAELLERHSQKVVFAESCTAGLISLAVSRIPGISRFHCGSAVVYQEETKSSWLGVSEADLADPAIGAVSPQTATAMSLGVLNRTPQADWSAAVTGHLGPGAPETLDGVIYLSISRRKQEEEISELLLERHVLKQYSGSSLEQRWKRQDAAAACVMASLLKTCRQMLEQSEPF